MRKEENKLIDAVLDLGIELKGMRKDMNHRFEKMDNRFEKMDNRFEKMEHEQHKTNLLLAEHTRAILKLADGQEKTNHRLDTTNQRLDATNLEVARNTGAIVKLTEQLKLVVEHEKRISKLERLVLK
ncbi:MAG: hypothetical protein ACYDCN_07995 [Bacteroidia bacterium]